MPGTCNQEISFTDYPNHSGARLSTASRDGFYETDIQAGEAFAACTLTPVYKRRFFHESDDALVFSNKETTTNISNLEQWISPFKIIQANSCRKESHNVDFIQDILFPIHKSVALIFAYLYGIPLDIHQRCNLGTLEDIVLHWKPLDSPNTKERSAAIFHYSNIFTAMRQSLESKNIHVTLTIYPQFSLSHALIEMYRFQWYSFEPFIKNDADSPSTAHVEFLSTAYIDDNEERMTEITIARVRIFLHVWYTTHVTRIHAPRIMEQCVRTSTLLDETSTQTLPLIRQETREHLARLLLLCHFDEFFHCLTFYSKKGDLLATFLQEALIETPVSQLSALWKPIMLKEQFFHDYLEHIWVNMDRLQEGLRSEQYEASGLLKESLFSFCYDILLGDESRLDWVIQQVFPNCLLSSFILGLFWRRLNISSIVKNLLRVFLTSPYDTGGITAFFYNSWLEAHKPLEGVRELRDVEVGISSLLSHNVDQFVEFLRSHSDYVCSPLLLDLIASDHSFPRSVQLCCEVFLRQSLHHSVPKDASFIYLYRALTDAHQELLHRPLLSCLNSNIISASHNIFRENIKRRSGRYTYISPNDINDFQMATQSAESSGKSFCYSGEKSFCQVISPFFSQPFHMLQGTLEELYASHCEWAALAHLIWNIRLSESYVTIRLFCLLLDVLITDQSCAILRWISGCIVGVLKKSAKRFIQNKPTAWEGLLIGLLAIKFELDHEPLEQLKNNDLAKLRNVFESRSEDQSYENVLNSSHKLRECPNGVHPLLSCCSKHEITVLSWRHQIRACFTQKPDQGSLQYNPFLDHLLRLPYSTNIECVKKNSDQSMFVFKIPEWCFIPDDLVQDAVYYLLVSRVYCPVLAFYVIAQFWNQEYQLLQEITENKHDPVIEDKEYKNCRDALYWLVNCLLEKFVVPDEFDTVMDLICSALLLDKLNHGNPKKCLLQYSQLQRLETFWTSYVAGMLHDIFVIPENSKWSLKENNTEYQKFNELLSQAQFYQMASESIDAPQGFKAWDPWVSLHFSCTRSV